LNSGLHSKVSFLHTPYSYLSWWKVPPRCCLGQLELMDDVRWNTFLP
jgi:hypothetical protein